MIVRTPNHPAHAALLLFLVLLIPTVRHGVEASMTTQMLVQIPLLVAVGLLMSKASSRRLLDAIGGWNHRGLTGLLLATIAGAYWMLPRSLDAAVTDPRIAVAKYLSIPLLIGVPFALSWPRMSFVVRGVFLLELIATFFRLGWLYLVSPERLCNSYLLGDQQALGRYMVLIGAVLFLWIAGKMLWGSLESFTESRSLSRSADARAYPIDHAPDS